MWLELLLEQERAEEVRHFLSSISSDRLFITDFTSHSIGILLSRLGRNEALLCFVQDVFVEGAVSLVHLKPEDIVSVAAVMQRFNLDFDDAYQYVSAEKLDLEIVSFDGDFDRTERGRKIPAQLEI